MLKFHFVIRFHDEVEITEKVTEFTRIEEGDNYKLVIKEVTKELSGKYTCKVVNDLGENTTSSSFTVYCEYLLSYFYFL